MKNRTLIPLETLDGSYTLQYQELNEHYHSKDGAKSESEYVYIKNGLERFPLTNSELNVLEVGLGTGLNAVLSYNWAKNNSHKINYLGLEPYPIEQDIIDFLKSNDPYFKDEIELFDQIHNSPRNNWSKFQDTFNFNFLECSLEDYQNDQSQFNVIFFDAFAPSRQEKIWSIENIQKCYDLLSYGGIMTSYCASGNFKRALKNAGFELIKNPGFGTKREMFIGVKHLK